WYWLSSRDLSCSREERRPPMTTKLFGVALLAMALSGGVMAQNNAEKKPVQQGPAITIPLSTGTAINASLLGELDSSKSKPGDVVNAIVTESVVDQRSELLRKGGRFVLHGCRPAHVGSSL